METAQQPATELPLHAQLIQLGTGHWLSKLIYTAAKLDIADKLADGPKSADELAGHIGLHAPSLHRFMRTLAGFGILASAGDKRYALTPLGETLKTGAPGSARSTILYVLRTDIRKGF